MSEKEIERYPALVIIPESSDEFSKYLDSSCGLVIDLHDGDTRIDILGEPDGVTPAGKVLRFHYDRYNFIQDFDEIINLMHGVHDKRDHPRRDIIVFILTYQRTDPDVVSWAYSIKLAQVIKDCPGEWSNHKHDLVKITEYHEKQLKAYHEDRKLRPINFYP